MVKRIISILFTISVFFSILVMFSCTGALLNDIRTMVDEYKSQNAFRIIDKNPMGTGVPVNATILITFSANIKESSVAGKVIVVNMPASITVTGSTIVTENYLTFTPDAPLVGMTEYHVSVLKSVTDTSGNGMDSDVEWNFTTSDATAPYDCSIVIQGGGAYSTDSDVTLTLAATDDQSVADMRISNSSVYENTGWEPYGTSYPSWILLAGEGSKTVYAWFRDNQGNISNRVSDTIIVDSQPPINGSVSINGGNNYTNSTNVTLTIFVEDLTAGMDVMRISDSNVYADNNWVTYGTSKSYILPAGSGTKTVYVWFRDKAGNRIVSPVSDSIVLDTVIPTISSRTPASGATGISPTTTVQITFSESMDQATLTTNSVYVTDAVGGVGSHLPATITKTATTVTLSYSSKLRFNCVNTVHMTAACKDLAGNPVAATNWTFTTRNAMLTYLGQYTAEGTDVFYDLEVKNNVAFIAANGPSYGQVYRVSVSDPATMTKTHKVSTSTSHDTHGIVVKNTGTTNNWVYAAQDSYKLFQLDASNLSVLHYGSTSYTGSKISICSNGSPFVITSAGELVGFSSSNITSSGSELDPGSFEGVDAIETYGSYSYVGDVDSSDYDPIFYIREVYTAQIGTQGATYEDEVLDITTYCGGNDGDTITGIASQTNDYLLVAIGPDTGVLVIFVGDEPIEYKIKHGTLLNAVDVSAAGNYGFVARSNAGIGLIEVNNGDNSRIVSESISLGSYYPQKIVATTVSGQIYVFALAKTTGTIQYLRSYRLD